MKLLKLFVRVEGRCDLPRNIVLVHEERVFYWIALYHFVNNSNIPNILSLEGQIVAAELNKLLSTAYRNTPDFMKQLLRDFKDPDPTRNRIGVPLNVDATYFHTTSSADIGKIIYFLEKPL